MKSKTEVLLGRRWILITDRMKVKVGEKPEGTINSSWPECYRRMAKSSLPLCLAMVLAVCGCRNHKISSGGVKLISTNGTVYVCDLLEVDSSVAPIILLSRSGGPGKDRSLKWEVINAECSVEGTTLRPVSSPTLYYKENGSLKTQVVPKSGVWLPLFEIHKANVEDFERVFEQLERTAP